MALYRDQYGRKYRSLSVYPDIGLVRDPAECKKDDKAGSDADVLLLDRAGAAVCLGHGGAFGRQSEARLYPAGDRAVFLVFYLLFCTGLFKSVFKRDDGEADKREVFCPDCHDACHFFRYHDMFLF